MHPKLLQGTRARRPPRHTAASLFFVPGPLCIGLASCAGDLAPPPLDQGCSLNSDCNAPLVCAYQRCHQECASDRDCPASERCITADRPFDVCQLPSERNCTKNSQCPTGLICAVDYQCRDQCSSNRDCISGQICSRGACADPAEVSDSGGLPNLQDSGVGLPCVLNSNCGEGGLVCRQGLCVLQCKKDVDCEIPQGPGGICVSHVCQTPAAACTLNSDCGDGGLVCQQGLCAVQCNADIDCEAPLGPGGECAAHICQTATSSGLVDAGTGTSDGGAGADSGGDAATEGNGDAGGGDGGPTSEDAGTAAGGIRVANLSPDGPAIDFCVAPQGHAGATFGATPYLATAGVSGGLGYGQVSEYVSVSAAPGSYITRVVAAGSSCATPLAGLADPDLSVPTPSQDYPVTVALLGIANADAGAPLLLHSYVDDGARTVSGGWSFRIIHAAPQEPPTDFEIGAGPTWTVPLQTGISYGQASSAAMAVDGGPIPDSQGYLTRMSATAQITATRGGSDITSGYAWFADTASAFFVGRSSSATAPLGVLFCYDSKAPTGHLSVCSLRTGAPTFQGVRFLNLAPDSPPADVCLTMNLFFGGPYNSPYGTMGLLAHAGVPGGAGFLQMSGTLVNYPDFTMFGMSPELPDGGCVEMLGDGVYNGPMGTETTVTLVETTFGPSPSYTMGIARGDEIDPSAGGNASFSLSNDLLTTYATDAGTIDVIATPDPASPITLFENIDPGGNGGFFYINSAGAGENSSDFAYLNAGTYGFSVKDHSTQDVLFSVSGVPVAAGTTTALHYFQTADGGALARCNMSPADAGIFTCAE